MEIKMLRRQCYIVRHQLHAAKCAQHAVPVAVAGVLTVWQVIFVVVKFRHLASKLKSFRWEFKFATSLLAFTGACIRMPTKCSTEFNFVNTGERRKRQRYFFPAKFPAIQPACWHKQAPKVARLLILIYHHYAWTNTALLCTSGILIFVRYKV